MPIEIRSIKTEEEYRAVEQLQKEIWGMADVEVIAHDLLMTAQKNGGALLGAFDLAAGQERLVGFVFGFVGLTQSGEVKHCSHIAGVVADYRDRNVGYLLKLAQREQVLAQRIDLITWTYDPLQSRNARFNLHKLGATCDTYLRNLYGEMRDELNAGIPSDRFQVDWRIASSHVETRLSASSPELSLSTLQSSGVVIINPPIEGDLLVPAEKTSHIQGERLLIRVPSDFQRIKAADLELARAWRQHTRAIFEETFSKGYAAVDLLVENGESYYLLELSSSQGR
jgi:predicted GNAT superfamily acetyltransferase